MKQIVLFLALLTVAPFADAQQYSCIPPEHKTFFTNGKDYLRGMRMDSVKYIGAEKVYYPFKTARVTLDHVGEYADTTGGSWWGSMIIEDTLTGITAIPTRHGDTVWIHTRAHLNDSWIFYKDMAVRYYEAKIIALDTATIAGISDSVKIIRIIAKDSNSVAVADPLNNLELVLSQHQGLLQAIGFYLFPYKNSYISPDYYFAFGDEYADVSQSALTFKRVSFHYPTNESIFDFDTGDVFRGSGRETALYDYIDFIYSISGAYSNDSTFSYQTHYYIRGQLDPQHSSTSQGTDTFTYQFGAIVDTNKMPEEWHSNQLIFYSDQDSSFCIRSSVYKLILSMIDTVGQLHSYDEVHINQVLKEGVGFLSYGAGTEANGSTTFNLTSLKKNGIACDNENTVLGLRNTLVANNNIVVYPNPANNTVTVSSESDKAFLVQIFDLTGRLLIQQSSRQGQLTIPIENLPNDLYLLKILSGNEMLAKKLSVLH